MRRASILLTVLLTTTIAASCAGLTAPAAPGTAAAPAGAQKPATPQVLPEALRWVQSSAEYVAAAAQAYRWATVRIEAEARQRTAGSWAVVLDADETILSNLPYQIGLAKAGVAHSPERWLAWVKEKAATPIPGAAKFLARIRELGGRIAIVTNRLAATECEDTSAVFRTLNLPFDAMLCRPDGASSDKNPRFRAVAAGETPASRTPVEIVAYVGDNILDFPGTSQAIRTQGDGPFTEFGVKWFLIPNPMYGSWQ